MVPDGALYSGAAAVSMALDGLLGSGKLFYSIYRFPGMRHAADAIYVWVANNRGRLNRLFSATPAIKQEPPWSPDG